MLGGELPNPAKFVGALSSVSHRLVSDKSIALNWGQLLDAITSVDLEPYRLYHFCACSGKLPPSTLKKFKRW